MLVGWEVPSFPTTRRSGVSSPGSKDGKSLSRRGMGASNSSSKGGKVWGSWGEFGGKKAVGAKFNYGRMKLTVISVVV